MGGGVFEGGADVAAGEFADLVSNSGREVGDALEQGGDVGCRGRLDFDGLEAGLKAFFELVEMGVAGADDGVARGQVVEEGEEADLGDVGDEVGFIDPDVAPGGEEVGVVKGSGEVFDEFEFELGAGVAVGGEFVDPKVVGQGAGDGALADSGLAVEEEGKAVLPGVEFFDLAFDLGDEALGRADELIGGERGVVEHRNGE